MKKEKRLPTIIGLLLLIFGAAGGVFLVRNGSVWLTRANTQIVPQEVKITNISDSGFSVSWATAAKTSGNVQYWSGENTTFIAKDDRDQLSGGEGEFFTHHVTIRGLKPATDYFFKINSAGKTFDNNGQPYGVKTAPALSSSGFPSDIAYGTVVKKEGTPAEGVIVYLTLANASPLSALTRPSGTWAIPLNLARSADLSSWATYDKEASIEEFFFQAGPEGIATAITTTKNDSPLPQVVLGENFDFRQQSTSPTPTPIEQTSSPRFSVENISTPSYSLRIINPGEGENISTSTPQIFGEGPAGENLTIIVESPETFRGSVIIGEDGKWQWVPPSSLTPGVHTVTVSLPSGQTVRRSFTVLAAGELQPAFTASPSATILPTATPTPTFIPSPPASPTAIPRTYLPSTGSGIPRSGLLTPTFLLSIMGISLIILGIGANFLGEIK